MANHSIPIQETRLGATAATPRGQVPNETEARREIEHVLSSSVFRGSKRCHDFTNYVCAKTLQGASGTLKERTIAIDVFGRRTNEAVGDDNIVRVGAREVRKRLALYYAGEGAEDPVRIELPTGTYVPVFRYQSEKSNFAVHPHAVEPRGMQWGLWLADLFHRCKLRLPEGAILQCAGGVLDPIHDPRLVLAHGRGPQLSGDDGGGLYATVG